MIREWNEESLDHRNTLLYAMGISEEDAKRPIIGLDVYKRQSLYSWGSRRRAV